jgi:predicted transcriptional regulator of viral defense system
MDRIKPKDIQFVQNLSRFDKLYWSVPDLEKILRLKNRKSLLVTLHRLVKYGIFTRIRRGIYRLSTRSFDVAALANLLYTPSYLSFESALSRYGVLSQVPYIYTFATRRRSKKMTVDGSVVEFRQLQDKLFFGYRLENGLFIADAEKAFLDALYLMKRGKTDLPLEEMNYAGLSKRKLQKYALPFPPYVQKALKELMGRLWT